VLRASCGYLLVLSVWLLVAPELDDGVLELDWPLVAPLELDDGVVVLDWPLEEPAPADPDVEELLLGLEDAPPPALFFSSVEEEEDEDEPEGDVGAAAGLELEDEDAAPEGEVVEPEGDVVEPDEEAEPEGDVLVSRAVRPVSSPQAARPRASATAAASVVSLMCSPPWLGKGQLGPASFGPA
jgi:hypothetical protein